MGEQRETAAKKLYEDECKALGVSAEEMEAYVLPPKDQEEGARAGGVQGPGHSNQLAEGQGTPQQPAAGEGAGTPPAAGEGTGDSAGDGDGAEFAEVTEEVLDEVFKVVKKRVGTAARKAAKKARKYYKKMKAAIKRKVKKWKKSAAGKKWMKKYARVKAKLGGLLKRVKGKKRLHVAGTDLAGRLREELAEGQGGGGSADDLEILENGAVIAAIIGDHLEEAELLDDAEAARKTSDNLMALVDKHEAEGKFSVPDEEMIPAVRSVGIVIDHLERIADGEVTPLAH